MPASQQKKQELILLPGLDKQFRFLLSKISLENKRSLVIGSGSEVVAKQIFLFSQEKVDLIVDNYDALINSRLSIGKNDFIGCSIMDYHATDFANDSFDLIYAQSSISTELHKKILKEIYRILKPDGLLCAGELVKHSNEIPKFVEDILNSSELFVLTMDKLISQYLSLGFLLIDKIDLSDSFFRYFELARQKALEVKNLLSKRELSFHKKLLTRFSHEANSFLKHGGDKYIRFHAFLFQKGVKN